MSYKVIVFEKEEEYIKAFINLPKRLYSKNEIMQNEQEEREILTGTHLLSHYFSVTGLLVMNGNQVVSRAVLTIYPKLESAYLGFFESEKNPEAVRMLFHKAEELTLQKGCNSIIGPIDSSFWLRYRFKINQFQHSYTGEPYNKDYYCKMWEDNGYEIAERYYSNHFMRVEAEYHEQKFEERLHRKMEEGYIIKSPSKKTFDETIAQVYDLLIELYQDFPAYSYITKEEFLSLFDYLKWIIRYNMVKMAYYNGKAVGFFISIPNYGNLVYGKLSLLDYIKLFRIRKCPKEYVMLYMGIDASHKGLGKAVTEAVKEELQKEGTPSVGALIRKGNINRDYFSKLVDYEYEYVLLKKELCEKR